MKIFNKKKNIVIVILLVVVVAIITNQIFWIINMYNSYEKEIVLDINKSLGNSVYIEVTERSENCGGFSFYSLYTGTVDSSGYIEKTVDGGSKNFTVKIDRQDPNANLKIVQYALKDINPLNVSRLNELFLKKMQEGKFPVKESYVEYFDFAKDDTLVKSSGKDPRFTSYISSDTMKIDINENMGVVAYVNNPVLTILGEMIFQLILSVVLIFIAIIGLIYLGRTIFRQWKEEKMRQDSVNAMAHEFRRPISAAVALVELIPYYIEKMETSKASRYAGQTVEELNRLTTYTQRIQQISNDDKSTILLEKSEIEISAFLEFLIKKYSPEGQCGASIDDKPVKININANPKLPLLYADRIHFANVIDNLIENAIKYTIGEVIIEISVNCHGKEWRISVKDSGIGLAKSELKCVFDRYYRADNRFVKSKAGYGLGLTYVKSIVEEHGGRIDVDSHGKGHGSEFVIYLPVNKKIN
jgi:Signal transduction histidine kinase